MLYTSIYGSRIDHLSRSIESFGSAVGGYWDAALAAAVAAATDASSTFSVITFKSAVYQFQNKFPAPTRAINSDATTYSAKPILLLGAQNAYTNRGIESTPTRGTVLDFRVSDPSGAKFEGNTCQLVGLANLTLTASAGFDTPFWWSTNTVPQVYNVCLFGQSGTGATCVQDAFLFGGPTQLEPSDSLNSGFQGYGGFVKNCFFRRIRRAVHGRAYFNSFVINENTIWNDCGASDDTAAIDIDCGTTGGSQVCTGNFVNDNLIEVTNYAYGIRLANAQQNQCHNSFYDPSQAKTKAAYKCGSNAKNNQLGAAFLGTKTGGGQLPLIDDDQWFTASGDTPTYASSTTFTVPTDRTAAYRAGKRLRITQTDASQSKTIFAKISSSAYSAVTTVTLTEITGATGLHSSISAIDIEAATAPSQINYTKVNAQGQYEMQPPFRALDPNYPSEVSRLLVTYPGGGALQVQPDAGSALGAGIYPFQVLKAVFDGGTALVSARYDGNLVFGDTAASSTPLFNGVTWGFTSMTGQNMTIHTGTGGSYVQLRAFGIRMQYYTNGATKGDLKWSDGFVDCTIPIGPGAYAVASLPSGSPGAFKSGTTAFATNGRRSGEGVGAGTGCPVWWDLTTTSWRTFYDNSVVAA